MSETPLLAQPPYPWLSQHWQNYTARVEIGKLQHAILIAGQEGLGCSELAIAMAQYLLCVAPQGPLSCGKCRSCVLLQAQSHPDFFYVAPEEKSTSIKVAQIREIGAFVSNTAQQGGRKVVILEPAEGMNTNAANALLKNLEEPSGDTVFILNSQHPARLLATVRSRCAQMVVGSPPIADGLAWLERNKVPNAGALLTEARGAPLKVIDWIDNNIVEQVTTFQADLLAFFEHRQSVVDCAKSLQSYGALWVVEQLQVLLEKAIRLSSVDETLDKGSEAGKSVLRMFQEGEPTKLFRLYDVCIQRKAQLMSGANPNETLLIEEMLMGLGNAVAPMRRAS